ncbi:RsmE family RNA methyltransferase [Tannockella kyphosi]|uniref:RsmE family RNA methyltransferase n=1 Tax=Tannockella kyphosi TaxID=2899121 RepID=UPI0020124C64|nr:RsmE family RNA methyltransferase [Tannockella kyphosi]
MQRYFIQEKKENNIYLQPEDIHHIKKVMRNKVGDSVHCIDPFGKHYLCSIQDVETGCLKIDKEIEEWNELDIEVTLIYAMPKGDKFEFVLQKATELGVHRIVPLQSRRCVVKLDKQKFEKKLERYQKIVKEAAEQSYRSILPKIESIQTIASLSPYLTNYALVAYEESAKVGEHHNFKKVMQEIKTKQSLTIIVGSEGGFDEDEIEALEKMGVLRCSLGKRILRSETAPLYMLSVIGYHREME